jgi:hypothetical protein
LAHRKKIKKVETIEAPQNRRFYGKMECIPLWPTYIGEKGRTLGKTGGIKARYYKEHPWGTHWELKEHIGNKGKMKKMLEESAEASDWVGRKLRSSHPGTNHELTTNKPYPQDVYTLLGLLKSYALLRSLRFKKHLSIYKRKNSIPAVCTFIVRALFRRSLGSI